MEAIVTTTRGTLRGTTQDGVSVFRGIPYARPPVGPLRLKAPQPATNWDGVRDATQFGPACPQNAPATTIFAREPVPTDEDCLTLNVWTPAVGAAEQRPVMVWIHGGAFATGTGRTPWYDGTSFARDGVVCVTINYRLGPLGFIAYPGFGDSNCGLRDQIAALEWVAEEIAAFGGDPGNVTIFGESAGGMSVGTLMGTPAAAGLFHKAIPQSGAGHNALPLDLSQRVGAALCETIGVTPAGLADVPVERLLEGFLAVQQKPDLLGDDFTGLAMAAQPQIDGDLLPRLPVESIASGSSAAVPTLVGTTAEEWKLFSAMAPAASEVRVTRPLRNRLTAAGRSPDDFVAGYQRPGRSELDVFNAIETDRAFRIPAIRLAEAQAGAGAPTFMYLFAWKTPAFGGRLGACHAVEIPFVFDVLSAGGPFVGEDPPQELADSTHAAWVSFAKTGSPGDWPAYDTTRRATMILDVPCRLTDDPDASERVLWDGLL